VKVSNTKNKKVKELESGVLFWDKLGFFFIWKFEPS